MVTDAETQALAAVAAFAGRLRAARPFNIGFPGAVDFDYTPLAELLTTHLLNNVGDPDVDGTGDNHSKEFERLVVDFVADLFRAPADDRWGYVTSGGTEGNLHALYVARTLYPRAVVYHSDACHYSIDKAISLLGLPSVRVRVDQSGEMDYDDLTVHIDQRREHPAIVVATAGTTMTEAVDDVRRVTAILDDLVVRERFVHVDAALSGIPLALLEPSFRPGFDFADGADSITVSGHKFLGSPVPCGIVVIRASHRCGRAAIISYTGTSDTTITGSRSGHAPLMLWYTIRKHGVDGLRQRADRSRDLARYLAECLTDLGWPNFRHDHAFTVVLRTPPRPVLDKWVLPTHNGQSHIIAMPGIAREQIVAFIADLRVSIATDRAASAIQAVVA